MRQLPLRLMPPALAAIVLAGVAGCQMAANDPSTIEVQPSFAVRYAIARVSPAVVQINVVAENYSRGISNPMSSVGSGFIIDKDGHILTNFHVASRAKRIDVTLANQEHVKATLVGSDHWTDLAVIQLDMEEVRQKKLSFEVAKLGTSSDVTLGQPVMAMGTPYGLSRTVTSGIVSQTDRYFALSRIDDYETGWFNNWIQTDAAINPGNSGGPLINLKGEVIGINTRAITEASSLGFAIPIDTAKEVFPILLAQKKVVRSYIGLDLQPMQDFEKIYNVESNKGVLIFNVENDSPAERAGLKTGDVLLAVNGQSVNARFPEQLAAVRKLVADFPIGSTLDLTIQRSTPAASTPATATASATHGTLTHVTLTTDRLESVMTDEQVLSPWGITVRDLTRAYLRSNRLPSYGAARIQGVLLLTLQVGRPGQSADLHEGDIIQAVNGQPVTSVEELQAAVAAWQKDPKMIGVDVRRGARGQLTVSLKP